jgi:hypothetical protein
MTDHAEPLEPEAAPQDGRLLQRRGLLAGGAAAAAAAVVALATAERADAGHDGVAAYSADTAMHLDVTNSTAGSTRISSNVATTAAFVGLNNYPVGIARADGILGRTAYITSNCAGVAGSCEAASGGIGVMGTSHAEDGTGVYGFAGSSVPSVVAPGGTGVYGSGPVYGMFARTTAGVGVHGESGTSVGLQGSSTSGTGVDGSSSSGTGVKGTSAAANGVHGLSSAGTGVRGETTSGVGVLGTADTAGIAGRFVGHTVVEGALDAGATQLASLNVTGPTTFAGAVDLGAAARLDKLALPKTSGVATLAKAGASVSIPNAPVVAGTLVLATLQKRVKGLWIEAAVPAVATRRITIHFNKKAPKGTKVAWMLVN